MVKLSYSQETYPKILLINQDTLVVINPNQVKKINLTYNQRDFLEAKNSVLNKTLNEYTLLSQQKDSIISLKIESESQLKDETLKMQGQIGNLTTQNNKLDIGNQKLKKGRKKWLISGIIGGIILTLLING